MSALTSNGYAFLTAGTGDSAKLIPATAAMASSSQTVLDTFIKPGLIKWVPDAAGRAALIPNPVQGDRVWRNDVGYTETYFDVVSVSNVGGRASAGWYRTGDYIDSAWQATAGSIVTASTGWSINATRLRALNGWVIFSVSFERTGGTLTVPADGNLTDVAVCTFLMTDYLPTQTIGLSTGPGPGRLVGGTISAAGIVSLTATTPTVSIVNTDTLSLTNAWPYG